MGLESRLSILSRTCPGSSNAGSRLLITTSSWAPVYRRLAVGACDRDVLVAISVGRRCLRYSLGALFYPYLFTLRHVHQTRHRFAFKILDRETRRGAKKVDPDGLSLARLLGMQGASDRKSVNSRVAVNYYVISRSKSQ